MTDRNIIQSLSQILGEGFNLDELHNLCFQLDIDEEELPSTKTPFINALLEHLYRHKLIPQLLKKGRGLRDRLD